MTEAPYLNPSVLPFVPSWFNPRYREKYPLFVAFLQAYHEWLETETGVSPTTYYTRGFLDLRDVDRTVEQFFVHLKTKYLDGIQLGTESDSRLLLKHAKDLYRAKGTPRGLQLFFRLLYDEAITLYYPKDDILRLSSGTWTRPFYLELSIDTDDWMLAGKAIRGLTSGAQGFVDTVARRLVAGRVSSVAYMSAVTGTFETGEIITPTDGTLPVSESPSIVGSMNDLILSTSGSGSGYSVGQIVPVNSPHGILGEARITSVVNQTGLIELDLNYGGYGYTNQSDVLVSDTVLVLSNIHVTNAYAKKYVGIGETITQPLGTYNFISANGTISNGAVVQAYSNGALVGNATVLQATYANSSAGFFVLAPTFGNVHSNNLYTVGNTVGVSLNAISGYVDQTAYGYSVGSANNVLNLANQTGNFLLGEDVVQSNPMYPTDGSVQATGTVSVTANGFINVSGRHGVFIPGRITGLSSGATANVTSMAISLGVMTTNGNWTSYTSGGVAGSWNDVAGNWIYGSSMTANVTFISSAITTKFGVSNNFNYTETIQLNTDSLAAIANAPLLGPYGLAANATANSSTPLNQCLTFANVVVGQVQNVYTITPGQQVDSQPMVVLIEPRTSAMNDYDLTLFYANASASFSIGEVITQANTGARGQIRSIINSTAMAVTNMRMNLVNQFITTTSSNTTILGTQSGAVANVLSVWADHDDPQLGRNANATTNTVTAVGAVSGASIVDSGLGYVQGEQVWLGFGNTPGANAAYGLVQLETAGTARGFYAQNGGFMSNNKKFFDGDFYQEFSYEISSSQQLANYQDTLERVMHVAGMKVFGRYVHSQTLNSKITSPGGSFAGQHLNVLALDFSGNNSMYIVPLGL